MNKIAGLEDGAEEDYEDFVRRLFKKEDFKAQLNHCALGLAGEVGEVVDIIKKHTVYGKMLDVAHLLEELGDLRFFIQALANVVGHSMDSIENNNIRKLNTRYPTGSYSNQQAISRADKKEPVQLNIWTV